MIRLLIAISLIGSLFPISAAQAQVSDVPRLIPAERGKTVFFDDDYLDENRPAFVPPKLEPERKLNAGTKQGQATLAVENRQLLVGKKDSIEIKFQANAPGHYYNVFFDGLDMQPAVLAVFDSDKKYLGDLLAHTGRSYRGPDADSWTYVPSEGIVGTKVSWTVGRMTTVASPLIPEFIPAGKCYLQLIYQTRFISPRFVSIGDGKFHPKEFLGWVHDNDKPDLFRSNVLEVELVYHRDE